MSTEASCGHKIFVLLSLVICVILPDIVSGETRTIESGPRLVFKYEVIDFGDVVSGTTVRKEVTFTNKGDAILEIQEIKAGCGCLIAELNIKTYKPGESGTMKVVFDSGARKGVYKGHLLIGSNDSVSPKAKVEIRANISELLTIRPNNIVVFGIPLGETRQKSFFLSSKSQLKVIAIPSAYDPNDIRISVTPRETTISPDAVRFDIKVTPYRIGRLTNHITLRAYEENSDKPITVSLPIIMTVDGPVVAKPSMLWFASLNGISKEKQVKLENRGLANRPLEISRIVFDPNLLEVKLQAKDEKGSVSLHVLPKKKAFLVDKSKTTNIQLEVHNGDRLLSLTLPVILLKKSQPAQNDSIASKEDMVQNFFVGNKGISFVKYDRHRRGFTLGWTGPPGGGLGAKDAFSLTIEGSKGTIVPRASGYERAFVVNAENIDESSLSIVDRQIDTIRKKKLDNDVLFVILKCASPPEFLINHIWKQILTQGRESTVLIVSGKVDGQHLRQIATEVYGSDKHD